MKRFYIGGYAPNWQACVCSGVIKMLVALFFTTLSLSASGQSWNNKKNLTLQDTLRGSVTPERKWWDLLRYDLSVELSISAQTIKGSNTIKYRVVEAAPSKAMQIDLQAPLKIDSVFFNGRTRTSFKNRGNVWYLNLPNQQASEINTVTIFYSGSPHEAIMPPWDGGWVWSKDKLGRPWITTASQGIGASVWYPCKDHQGDEPDQGISLSLVVPDSLVGVANGQLKAKKININHSATYTWEVASPINNYGISLYIGHYTNLSESYQGLKGALDLNFWVLDYNKGDAMAHLVPEARKMMKSFEHWFGPYPFYEDGFKLVDAPFGMEHQSAVAYGNEYKMGFRGRDYSGTGWGMQWDFLLVHESAHEWFGNSITAIDPADKWIHESFACYADILYMVDHLGEKAANDYVLGTRKNIRNDEPIIGPYGVGKEGSSDMYPKGRNMLHMIRAVINDDQKFRSILLGLNREFYHQTVTTQQIEFYITQESGINITKVFDQYLRTTQIPAFEYQIHKGILKYRYTDCVADFVMPLRIEVAGTKIWIKPTTAWQKLALEGNQSSISVGDEFYIDIKEYTGAF